MPIRSWFSFTSPMAWPLNGLGYAAWLWARVDFSAASAWPQLKRRFWSSWHVSSYGRMQRPNGTVTWGSRHSAGYLTVRITRRQMYVHRLVMHVFHGPPQDGRAWQVNHLDGNKTNNQLENLQWVTPKQNVCHSYESTSRRTAGPELSMPVTCRSVGSNNWKAYASMTDAAKGIGISVTSVSTSCRLAKAVKGFECQQALATAEAVSHTKQWKQMLVPRSGDVIPGKMVSSRGRFKGRNGRIFRGHVLTSGYCTTSIRCRCQTQTQTVLVHQLVARAFLWPPPSPSHTQINHKDGNKSNNSVDNLEYVTPAQNVAHSYRVAPARTYSNVKPLQSRIHGSNDQWRCHASMKAAAKYLGVHVSSIHKCLNGRCQQTGGYEFRTVPPLPDLPGEEWRVMDLPALLEERPPRS